MNSYSNIHSREPEILKKKFLLENTLHALRNPVDFLESLTKNYGPIVSASFLGKRYFIVQHPDYIQHVLLQNYKSYCKPGATKLLRLFLGEGLSTSNGELWLSQRRIMQPAFHKQRLVNILHIIEEETNLLIDRLNELHLNKTININHEFLQLTISIISRAMFSTALKQEMETMVSSLEELADFASSWIKSLIKVPLSWPTAANGKFHQNCKKFDLIIESIIERRRKEISKPNYIPHGDLLDMLLNYADEEGGTGMSKKQLRDEVTTMFMAGHETTAQTLSWIIYHIAKEKNIAEQVQNEGVAFSGKNPATLENLSGLIYTKQVVSEGLRHYPPIWALVRKPLINDCIEGVKISPNTNVLINIYGMHHHPQYWDTPNDFNPDHFSAEAQMQRPQFAYLPFGGGPRLCLGNNFAMMVMQVVISKLLQHYDFDITTGYAPVIEPNITLRAKDGIQIFIRKHPSSSLSVR